uniref:Uncharacterized protein n=1 Tax=Parascaris equorum TaxID=6256 RepID=A0A914RHY3_PAREQ
MTNKLISYMILNTFHNNTVLISNSPLRCIPFGM